jgi:hypothetical protein
MLLPSLLLLLTLEGIPSRKNVSETKTEKEENRWWMSCRDAEAYSNIEYQTVCTAMKFQ